MAAKHLNTETFKENVADISTGEFKFVGERPVLIDFFATWCGPCKQLAPVIDEMAEKYEGKVDIYKVDVDEAQELAEAFGIRSIPTLLFVPMSGEPKMHTGSMPKNDLVKAIEGELL